MMLQVRNLKVSYGATVIVDGIDLDVPQGGVTTIIGPNGCGKSTLLRATAGLIARDGGTVTINGVDTAKLKRREIARQLAVLPQAPVAPEGLTVRDLVSRGRHPHQSWLRQASAEDAHAVDAVMELTNIAEFAERPLERLSGGQRQRAWIAMVLAQDTPLVFLDEPTTYLDLSHSVEVLSLVRRLADQEGRTVLMVLHDLNLAARYSDQLIVMQRGEVRAVGAPAEVVTESLLSRVFDLPAVVASDPVSGGPLVVPW
ncbi:cobalamin/Fe3+-siderophore ABC transporter ATP-binding protein [Corynebacterium hadale]|uniref:Cobalamin/Fe3+-siderophore ABC transporter ATP-binding protein n=1 Tax=Corynebacterium hadale TaxID=2026255 RepID=A0A269PCC4_9CORY|nr:MULTISPECIES: ABC transporter ATP-binding protein [Corynebacterium]PAJ68115.1 cobalamin/Fe3+-siderophore ABC transporter ATP-binding protein [Corynebacterium hadale]PAT03273.1 cobalamin/Fe3+-siderophore ABC transporter ATP-binding protein [Corynebacterium sp. NML 150383]PAT05534.1 cobalamin/Fe3+-siderophore ABC transporter ATP-binding protein [Corynebacterium hadale]PAT11111.1 cobalamin/Fe3+-siderophore ABC transporter ATP-binding protein [Corynebacterium hadale]WKC61148.1 putative sideroph